MKRKRQRVSMPHCEICGRPLMKCGTLRGIAGGELVVFFCDACLVEAVRDQDCPVVVRRLWESVRSGRSGDVLSGVVLN